MGRKTVSRLLLAAGAIFTLGTPAARAAIDRLDGNVHPTFEFIDLEIDADQTEYSGSVRIELRVEEPTSRFAFHAEVRSLDRVVLRAGAGELALEHETGEEGFVTVRTEERLEPGPLTLEIDFSNDFNTKMGGLFRVETGGRHYLFTQFEAVDARKAFPCWDEPAYKIPFQMRLRIPEAHEAVANAAEESRTVADGWKTLTFRRTPPMPTYLLALAAGPLETTGIPGLSIPGRVVTTRGKSAMAAAAVAATPPILAALEEYFGIPYPYEKLDLIAIPSFPGAMENPGAITYGESILLIDDRTASVGQRRTLVSVHAHELAHIWFGALVTMKWWEDLWLNESFASWLGDKVVGELYPRYRFDLRESRSVQRLMSRDARPSTKPIRKPIGSSAQIFEDLGLNYGKGQRVLEMTEKWIGPDTFRRGVVAYLQAHEWGNADAADLWDALSEAAGRDLHRSLSSFLDLAGLPLVTVEPAPQGGVLLRQTRFRNHGVKAPEQRWELPVRLRYARSGGTETKTVVLTGSGKTVALGGGIEWILPDDGAYGYYRWSVPASMLRTLADRSAGLLTARERVSFLGNAAALLDAGLLGGADYLQVLNAFAEDPEPEVLSTVITGIAKVKTAFVSDDLREPFARYIRSTLRPMLERIGLEKRAGEQDSVASLRSRIVGWLGEEGRDAEIRAWAVRQSTAYMEDPSRIDPTLASTVLGVAALEGSRELFNAYVQRFENTKIPVERLRYLNALAWFQDPALQDRALDYSLEGPLRPTEVLTVASNLHGTEAAEDRAFDWVLAHYGELRDRISPWRVPSLPFYAGGCSLDRLETARAFFSQPDHRVNGTGSSIRKVADQVQDCAHLRRREGREVARFLESVPGGD